MGSEKGSKYYNENIHKVILTLEKSPWRDLYETAASLLPPPSDNISIADLGCGTGRFARLLADRGYKRYWGVDFSEVRIREAKRYTPEFEFSVGNLYESSVYLKLSSFTHIVLLEVLEHLEKDFVVLSAIPPNRSVIFSIPNYDSAAHTRFFNDRKEVIERFESVLDFSTSISMTVQRKRQDRMIFLFSCLKR